MSLFIRRQTPPELANHDSYRPFLRVDFHERCAYCERTEAYLGGQDFFTIDHFRPKSKFPEFAFHYPNLYYACGKCNQHKAGTWPNPNLLANGFRFSDPCEEDMYSEHLTELGDGTLNWLDNCGWYTCEHIRLNRPDLLMWRQLRREMTQGLGTIDEIQRQLRAELALAIDLGLRERISAKLALIESFATKYRSQLGLAPV